MYIYIYMYNTKGKSELVSVGRRRGGPIPGPRRDIGRSIS